MNKSYCDNCTHVQVCRYPEKFYAITKKLSTFKPFDNSNVELQQIDWIDFDPSCKYYTPVKTQVLRNGENSL